MGNDANSGVQIEAAAKHVGPDLSAFVPQKPPRKMSEKKLSRSNSNSSDASAASEKKLTARERQRAKAVRHRPSTQIDPDSLAHAPSATVVLGEVRVDPERLRRMSEKSLRKSSQVSNASTQRKSSHASTQRKSSASSMHRKCSYDRKSSYSSRGRPSAQGSPSNQEKLASLSPKPRPKKEKKSKMRKSRLGPKSRSRDYIGPTQPRAGPTTAPFDYGSSSDSSSLSESSEEKAPLRDRSECKVIAKAPLDPLYNWKTDNWSDNDQIPGLNAPEDDEHDVGDRSVYGRRKDNFTFAPRRGMKSPQSPNPFNQSVISEAISELSDNTGQHSRTCSEFSVLTSNTFNYSELLPNASWASPHYDPDESSTDKAAASMQPRVPVYGNSQPAGGIMYSGALRSARDQVLNRAFQKNQPPPQRYGPGPPQPHARSQQPWPGPPQNNWNVPQQLRNSQGLAPSHPPPRGQMPPPAKPPQNGSEPYSWDFPKNMFNNQPQVSKNPDHIWNGRSAPLYSTKYNNRFYSNKGFPAKGRFRSHTSPNRHTPRTPLNNIPEGRNMNLAPFV